jgi:hypothetical protein
MKIERKVFHHPSTMVPTYPSTISRSYGAGGAGRDAVFDPEAQTRREDTEIIRFFLLSRKRKDVFLCDLCASSEAGGETLIRPKSGG